MDSQIPDTGAASIGALTPIQVEPDTTSDVEDECT